MPPKRIDRINKGQEGRPSGSPPKFREELKNIIIAVVIQSQHESFSSIWFQITIDVSFLPRITATCLCTGF